MKNFEEAIKCLINQEDASVSAARSQSLGEIAQEVMSSQDAAEFAAAMMNDTTLALSLGELSVSSCITSLALRMFTAGIRVGIEMEKQEMNVGMKL